MKTLSTIEAARKELNGSEQVQTSVVGHNLLRVTCVRYMPGNRTGKFHQYQDCLMPLEIFKQWSVDFDGSATTSSLK